MRRFSIKTCDGELEYKIARRNRVKKRMHMELGPAGELVVIAPAHWSETQINKTLRQNISKVERFVLRARSQQVQPLQYCDGELHLFLGELYPLRINSHRHRNAALEFDGNELLVSLSGKTGADIQGLLESWYRRQAQQVFNRRLELVSARADWARDRKLTLKLRRMKRTWGNCSSCGVIKLNTHLIKAPLRVIDSVVAHELCHLVEMNHGKAFYRLLKKLNPDWSQDRKTLKQHANLYLR